jgi:DNA topoisomerase-1
MLQIGAQDDEVKKFASLPAGSSIETITMEEALQAFALPREL